MEIGPWLTVKSHRLLKPYIKPATLVYKASVCPLHQGGSISMFVVGGLTNIKHTLNLMKCLYCKNAALDLNLKILNVIYDVDCLV